MAKALTNRPRNVICNETDNCAYLNSLKSIHVACTIIQVRLYWEARRGRTFVRVSEVRGK